MQTAFPFRAVAAACLCVLTLSRRPSSFVLFSKGKHHHNNQKGGWTAFPHDNSAFVYDGAALKKNWARLHKGDAEPFPADKAVEEAWRLYHAGDFQGRV